MGDGDEIELSVYRYCSWQKMSRTILCLCYIGHQKSFNCVSWMHLGLAQKCSKN